MATPKLFSEQEIRRFHRDGFILVRSLFGAEEMREIAAWTDIVAAYPEVPGRYMMYSEESRSASGERLLSRIENFCPYHREFEKLMQGPKMLGAVSELFGEPAVLFKDKINFKLPGGSGFEAHQDVQAGWDTYAGLFITATVAIDPTTPENGCLEMAAGQHRRGLIGQMWKPLSETDMAGMRFVPYPMDPGDAIFFDSFAPHRSAPNRSNQPRRVLYITYNRASEGDNRAQYYADKRKSYPPDCERESGKQYKFRV